MPLKFSPSAPVPGVPTDLHAPILQSGQYSIDNYIYGRGTDVTVQQTAIDPVTLTTQDQSVGAGDGMRFGVDYATTGKVLTHTGNILVSSEITAMDVYSQLEAYWNNPAIRMNPGATSILRICYPNSAEIRRVYGRGRAITPTLGMVSRGNIGFVAAFQCADGSAYSDNAYNIGFSLTGVKATTTTNLISNPNFQTGTAGYSWTGGALTVQQPGTPGALPNGFFTPSGSANPTITSPLTPITPNFGYQVGIKLYRSQSFGSVAVHWSILLYDINSTLIGTFATKTALLPGSPYLAYASNFQTFSTNLNNARFAAIQVEYVGTPTTSDTLSLSQLVFQLPPAGIVSPYTPVDPTPGFPFKLVRNAQYSLPLVNTGPLDTWPWIQIYGPVTNPFVYFQQTDLGIGLNTWVPGNKVVTIDTRPWVRSAVDRQGDSWAGYIVGNALNELSIPPGIVTCTAGGQDVSGQAQIRVYWRTAHAMIGGTIQ